MSLAPTALLSSPLSLWVSALRLTLPSVPGPGFSDTRDPGAAGGRPCPSGHSVRGVPVNGCPSRAPAPLRPPVPGALTRAPGVSLTFLRAGHLRALMFSALLLRNGSMPLGLAIKVG